MLDGNSMLYNSWLVQWCKNNLAGNKNVLRLETEEVNRQLRSHQWPLSIASFSIHLCYVWQGFGG